MRFCKYHNVGCVIGLAEDSQKLSARMMKVRRILQFIRLNAGLSRLIYVDVDTIFTNPMVNLFENRMFPDDVRFALTNDYVSFGDGSTVKNGILGHNFKNSNRMCVRKEQLQTGVMFVQPSEEVRLLLKDWLELSETMRDKAIRWSKQKKFNDQFAEETPQVLMLYLFEHVFLIYSTLLT